MSQAPSARGSSPLKEKYLLLCPCWCGSIFITCVLGTKSQVTETTNLEKSFLENDGTNEDVSKEKQEHSVVSLAAFPPIFF